MKNKIALTIGLIVLAIGVWLVFGHSTAEAPEGPVEQDAAEDVTPTSDNVVAEEVAVEPLQYSIDELDSIWLVVNRERPISQDYIPQDLRRVNVTVRTDKSESELSLRGVAASALESLFDDAAEDGIELLLGSGYRDAELQAFYYNNYVASAGQEEADKFSARPGTSEHQIGLSADVAPATQNCYLSTCFADTPEGQWVAENAHAHGFVIRYPLGKEEITGYQFEPWHLRYVGVELATELYESGQTLEEYFGLTTESSE